MCGRGASFVVARNTHVVVIRLWGEVTDDVSNAWRAATQRTFDVDGYPPFGFVDALGGKSVGSLPGRIRSAEFMRSSAARMKRIALVSNAQGSFVVKTVMRVAGANNVELIGPDEVARVLGAMRDGRDPFG